MPWFGPLLATLRCLLLPVLWKTSQHHNIRYLCYDVMFARNKSIGLLTISQQGQHGFNTAANSETEKGQHPTGRSLISTIAMLCYSVWI